MTIPRNDRPYEDFKERGMGKVTAEKQAAAYLHRFICCYRTKKKHSGELIIVYESFEMQRLDKHEKAQLSNFQQQSGQLSPQPYQCRIDDFLRCPSCLSADCPRLQVYQQIGFFDLMANRAQLIQQSLTILDAHDHTGSGSLETAEFKKAVFQAFAEISKTHPLDKSVMMEVLDITQTKNNRARCSKHQFQRVIEVIVSHIFLLTYE